jgi:DNA-binding GntR family transcriptional regulator
MSEHEEMIVHLRARDGDALGTLLREHIRGKKGVIAANYGEGGAAT